MTLRKNSAKYTCGYWFWCFKIYYKEI